MSEPLVLVHGHRFRRSTYKFPHLCPGEGCAIGAWLLRRHNRCTYGWLTYSGRELAQELVAAELNAEAARAPIQ